MEVLKKYGKLDLLDSAVSCNRTRNHPPGYTHCGVCSQCVDRIFATHAAGVENYDDTGLYHFNFLKNDLEEDEITKALTDYIRLAQSFKDQDINGFYLSRGSEIVEVEEYADGGNELERIEKIYNLCQRHSMHVEKALKRMRELYDLPLNPCKPKSFFNLIIGARAYQSTIKEPLREKKEKVELKVNNDFEKGNNGLKKFKRGELKKELESYIKELKLEKYDTVPSSKILWITNQLRKKGFDANEGSVASVLRKMDYSFGHEP